MMPMTLTVSWSATASCQATPGRFPHRVLAKAGCRSGCCSLTMQTACGVFGGEYCADKTSIPPLMVANAGDSNRPAISSLNCPHILAVEKCREHVGVHPCDRRRSISEYRNLFPGIDFSLIENDEDALWKTDIRELDEEIANRGMEFFDWLWTRKEKEIAIVTHSGFLAQTLAKYGIDCHLAVREEITKLFANCELRSMVLVDKRMLGSDPATTNYPGKIPNGPDLPSEIAIAQNKDTTIQARNPIIAE